MAGVTDWARYNDVFKMEGDEKESAVGTIIKVSHSVVIAKLDGAAMNDVVHIGNHKQMGEIIKVDGDIVTIDVFANYHRIDVGDEVVSTGEELTAELGPGILMKLFDGIQTPLDADKETKLFIRGAVDTPSLDRKKLWEFEPSNFKEGDRINGGDIFGKVYETELVTHYIMLPPNQSGRITFIAPAGNYTIEEEIIKIETEREIEKSFTMMHKWPIRQPRPIEEKLVSDTPFHIGQRFTDGLFPVPVGGTCIFPGPWGCGKGTTIYNIQKAPVADVVVFAACSERSNELYEKIWGFPEDFVYVAGTQVSAAKRMSMVVNVADFPAPVREASIFTGSTIAEYYRDQGRNSVLIADNTVRWVETFSESAHLKGESLSTDIDGFPSSLSSQLSHFYGRSGKVACLGSPNRIGSMTIFASVSGARNSFQEDYVVNHTLDNCCDTFWALDAQMARMKHFPEVNWLYSFTDNVKRLDNFYNTQYDDFAQLRTKAREILKSQNALQSKIEIIGKDKLDTASKITFLTATMLRDDFLQQNIFTPYDTYCPMYKTKWILKNMVTFHELAQEAVKEKKITMSSPSKWGIGSILEGEITEVCYQLTRMKFQDPHDGEHQVVAAYQALHDRLVSVFKNL